jgi:hypothetical protein
MEEGYMYSDEILYLLVGVLIFGGFILVVSSHHKLDKTILENKPTEKVKEEVVKKEVINKKVIKEEIKKEAVITQPIKQGNKIFNLQNLGWVSFAVVMFLLFSRDNDKAVYSISELGLSAETLRYDDDFQVAVLGIVENYCWVVLNENHDSGYGKKIECYK